MTLVFRISPAKKCQTCYGPVKDFIYQHQCRPNFQPFCCYDCLIDREICRYCYTPYTYIKEATTTWAGQRYYETSVPEFSDSEKPDSPGPRRYSSEDEDESVENMDLLEPLYGPYPTSNLKILDSLSSSDFWGSEGQIDDDYSSTQSPSHILAKWNSKLFTEEYESVGPENSFPEFSNSENSRASAGVRPNSENSVPVPSGAEERKSSDFENSVPETMHLEDDDFPLENLSYNFKDFDLNDATKQRDDIPMYIITSRRN